jgi:hypothetical protein
LQAFPSLLLRNKRRHPKPQPMPTRAGLTHPFFPGKEFLESTLSY